MKTIALFGGTGKTGQEFLKLSLNAGYQIKALARNPDNLLLSSKNLTPIKGDVLHYADVEKTVEDSDCVVSLFGHVKNSPRWLQTNGTTHIVSAMQKFGTSKIISLSGGALPYPEKDQPKFIDRLIRGIMGLAVPQIVEDAIAHHKVLEKSGLDWIIVRGPRLTMHPMKGSYRVGWVGVNSGTQIGRADLANFILSQIEDNRFVRELPFVSY